VDWNLNSRHKTLGDIGSLKTSILEYGEVVEPILAARISGKTGFYVLRGFRRTSAVASILADNPAANVQLPARIIIDPVSEVEVPILVADDHLSAGKVGVFRLYCHMARQGYKEASIILRNADAFLVVSKDPVSFSAELEAISNLDAKNKKRIAHSHGQCQVFGRILTLGDRAVEAYERKLIGELKLATDEATLTALAKLPEGLEKGRAIAAWTVSGEAAAPERPSIATLEKNATCPVIKALLAYLRAPIGTVGFRYAEFSEEVSALHANGYFSGILFDVNVENARNSAPKVETTQVETTPVETTPVETTPVETTPVETKAKVAANRKK
jgi:hypothetical protein